MQHTQTAFNTRCSLQVAKPLHQTQLAAVKVAHKNAITIAVYRHCQVDFEIHNPRTAESPWWWWRRLCPRLRGLWATVIHSPPEPLFFFFFFGFVLFWKWRSARAHRFHFFFLGQDQSTVAPLLKPGSVPSGTVAECSLTSCV